MGALKDGLEGVMNEDRRRSITAMAAELRDVTVAGTLVGVTKDTVIVTDIPDAPEPAPIMLYRLITLRREVFEVAADSYVHRTPRSNEDSTGGWFLFFIAGRIVYQVLASQVLAIFLAYDELPDDDIPMSEQSEALEAGEEDPFSEEGLFEVSA